MRTKTKKRLLHYTLAPLLLLTALTKAPQRARAALYIVVYNTNDSGSGSLRQAITYNNSDPGTDITFCIPETDPGYSPSDGVWTITLLSPLPAMTGGNTIVDGTTQTYSLGDTNPAGPEVQIDGCYLGPGVPIFTVASDWNQILGLALNWADYCAVEILSGTVGNRVKDSYIGIGPDGQSDAGNGTGVVIYGARESIVAHNVISWNDQYGILITGSGADDNMIRRNTIGLDALGTAKAPNGSHGVYIAAGAEDNIVGGLYGEESYRNTISGNGEHGVYISGSGADNNSVGYNYIGVDGAGTGLHNVGNVGSGVAIENFAWGNEVSDNVISGNGKHGAWISGSGTARNEFLSNIIGADAQVTTSVPNGNHGVAIYDGATDNDIRGNVIVGSSWCGVAIVNSDGNHVQANAIGTDAHIWTSAIGTNLGNNYHGVHVVGSSGNLIDVNHIAYNGILPGRAGVRVEGASATGNTIDRNSIHDNSGKGIELVDGGNGGLPAPTITQATCRQVQGSTCAGCQVQIFSDSADEGRIREEWWTKAHATTGAFSWSEHVLHGPNVTVTATDSQGNTSEFSAPFNVGLCPKAYLPLVLR
jgi:parallel beta-helix repeat protein